MPIAFLVLNVKEEAELMGSESLKEIEVMRESFVLWEFSSPPCFGFLFCLHWKALSQPLIEMPISRPKPHLFLY